VLVLCGVATLVAWFGVARRLDAEDEARFLAFSRARQVLFGDHLASLTQTVRSFQGLFLASESVSADEFTTHFRILNVGDSQPEVLGVQFMPSPAGVAAAYDEAGYHQPEGSLAVASPAFDLPPEDDTEWRAMLRTSRDSGQPDLMPPRTLSGGGVGLVLTAPVYRAGVVPAQVDERQRAYLGHVDVVIDAGRLMGRVLPEGATLPYRVRVIDIGAMEAARRGPVRWVHDTRPEVGGPVPALEPERLADEAHLQRFVTQVGQRLWVLSFQRDPVNALAAPQALLALLAGGAVTTLLGVMLHGLLRRHEQSADAIRRLDAQVESDDARLRGVIDQSGDGIVSMDPAGVLLSANPAAQAMFGLSGLQLRGRALTDLAAVVDRERVLRQLAEPGAGADAVPCRIEFQALRADGSTFPLRMTLREIGGPAGRECLGVLRDLSASARPAAVGRRLAQHDTLTGMLNRDAFQQHLRDALAAQRARVAVPDAPASPLAMMVIDLDRFKKINETLGHQVGDRVLLAMAGRLRGVVGEGLTLARLGGDEFAVLRVADGTPFDVEPVATRILKTLSEPLEVDGHSLRLSASIGIATTVDARDIDDITLMSRADSAMYLAKNAGRSQYHVHRQEDRQTQPQQLRLEADLHGAIERQELELHFQPQFDCRTGRLVGAEALLRWRHRQLGMVSPVQFIPLAEESGLIVPIGRWVLDEACRQARLWQTAGGRAISVAVNLSTRQMMDDDVVGAVRDALARHDLSPGRLELEITESAAVSDTEQARGMLDRLGEIGVSVSIDDFGVGYSSLSYLRDLPVKRFKIDRSFLTNVPGDPGSSRLVSAMVSMARSLEVELVAEGVEHADQLDFLVEQGCDVAQGYLLGRPIPGRDFLERLVRDGFGERASPAAIGEPVRQDAIRVSK
jgi:diguanylate cyclase (GGDEF)-like protein/PAS domain S-box-containing protein